MYELSHGLRCRERETDERSALAALANATAAPMPLGVEAGV